MMFTCLSCFGTKASLLCLLCVLLLLGAIDQTRAANKVGKLCSNDTDCGTNEICKWNANIAPACQRGTCQCKSCHSVAFPGETCSPVQLRKPCDSRCSERQCDASCSMRSPGEVYLPNTQCLNSFWPGYHLVTCDKCFNFVDGRCVREPNSTVARGATCSNDCDCAATTACLGKCRCPAGTVWESALKTCRPVVVSDACSSDFDCRHDNFNGFGVCANGTCRCDNNTSTGYQISSLVEQEGATSTVLKSTVCLAKTLSLARVNASNTCSLDLSPSTAQGVHNETVATCQLGSFCFQCPEPTIANNTAKPSLPKCRTLKAVKMAPIRGNNSNSTDLLESTCLSSLPNNGNSSSLRASSKLGQLCRGNSECGFNEACQFAFVEPACSYGVCSCLPCAIPVRGVNETLTCLMMRILRLGDNCTTAPTERYPANARCSGGAVVCQGNHLRRGSRNECVPSVVGADLGDSCRLYSGDCSGNLECQGPARCDCPGTNSIWDDKTKTCRQRSLGDTCQKDSDCNDATSPTSGSICLSGKCSCDVRFSPGQVRCSSENKPVVAECLRCPEDNSTSPCRNVTEPKISVNKSNEPMCFSEKATLSKTCPVQGRPTLGKACQVERHCATNEECVAQLFEPSCINKQCKCKGNLRRGAKGTCEPVYEPKLGDNCTNADNEAFIKGLRCNNDGKIECDECFKNVNGTCQSPMKKVGASCQADCDCSTKKCVESETANGTASRVCACPHAFMIWIENQQACVLREFGDSCKTDIDCQADGRRGKQGGYTRRNGAACVNGTCACQSGFVPTTVTFLLDEISPDYSMTKPITNNNATKNGSQTALALVDKQICVTMAAQSFTNATIGDSCVLDPIYHSSDASMLSLGVCQRGFVCIKCPGDFGKCRRAFNQTEIDSGKLPTSQQAFDPFLLA